MLYNDPVTFARNSMINIGIDSTILELLLGGINADGTKKNIARELDKLIVLMCDDFNLISGDAINIKVANCKRLDDEGKIYYVPASERKNRDIREVYKLRTGVITPENYLGTTTGNGTMVSGALTSMASAFMTPISNDDIFVELIDTNTFKITSSSTMHTGYTVLVADIENRDRLKQLKKGSYPKFFEIALSYVKSYIYNNRIAIKKNALHGGHSIESIESTIEEYSGAREEYTTFLSEDVGKMLTFADESKINRLMIDSV